MFKRVSLSLPSLSKRTAVTCLCVHDGILAVGTDTGRVYLYTLRPLTFLKVLNTPTVPSIERILMVSHELMAFTTADGVVTCVEGLTSGQGKVIKTITGHKKSRVVDLVFSKEYNDLFTGDSNGTVMRSNPMERFSSSTVLWKCDNPIVQLAIHGRKLLVSSTARCYVLDVTKKPVTVLQVGTKLRNGPYGVCFDPMSDGKRFFSARPGKRVWMADAGAGAVLNTLKMALPIPQRFLPDSNYSGEYETPPEIIKKQVQFHSLKEYEQGIVAYGGPNNGLIFINPEQVSVSSWFNELGNVRDCSLDPVMTADQCGRVYLLHEPQTQVEAKDNVREISCVVALTPAVYLADQLGLVDLSATLRSEAEVFVADGETPTSVPNEKNENEKSRDITTAACIATAVHYACENVIILQEIKSRLEEMTSSDLVSSEQIDALEKLLLSALEQEAEIERKRVIQEEAEAKAALEKLQTEDIREDESVSPSSSLPPSKGMPGYDDGEQVVPLMGNEFEEAVVAVEMLPEKKHKKTRVRKESTVVSIATGAEDEKFVMQSLDLYKKVHKKKKKKKKKTKQAAIIVEEEPSSAPVKDEVEEDTLLTTEKIETVAEEHQPDASAAAIEDEEPVTSLPVDDADSVKLDMDVTEEGAVGVVPDDVKEETPTAEVSTDKKDPVTEVQSEQEPDVATVGDNAVPPEAAVVVPLEEKQAEILEVPVPSWYVCEWMEWNDVVDYLEEKPLKQKYRKQLVTLSPMTSMVKFAFIAVDELRRNNYGILTDLTVAENLELSQFLQRWLEFFKVECLRYFAEAETPDDLNVAVMRMHGALSDYGVNGSASKGLFHRICTEISRTQSQLTFVLFALLRASLALPSDSESRVDIEEFITLFALFLPFQPLCTVLAQHNRMETLQRVPTLLKTTDSAVEFVTLNEKCTALAARGDFDGLYHVLSTERTNTSTLLYMGHLRVLMQARACSTLLLCLRDYVSDSSSHVSPQQIASMLEVDMDNFNISNTLEPLPFVADCHNHTLAFFADEKTMKEWISSNDNALPDMTEADEGKASGENNMFVFLSLLMRFVPSARQDVSLVHTWLHLGLVLGRPAHDKLFTTTDVGTVIPQPGAHEIVWPCGQVLINVLNFSHIFAFSRRALITLFARYGFYPGLQSLYLSTYASSPTIMAALDIAVSCDDKDTVALAIRRHLNDRLNYVLQVSYWHHLVHLMATNVGRNKVITLTYILREMMAALGPTMTVSIMLNSPRLVQYLDVAGLSPTFFNELVAICVLRQQQKAFKHQMLEAVDSYLWGQRSVNISPQVYAARRVEIEPWILSQTNQEGRLFSASARSSSSYATLSHRDRTQPLNVTELDRFSRRRMQSEEGKSDADTELSMLLRLVAQETATATDGEHVSFHEDGAGHWGVELDLTKTSCFHCNVPLKVPPLSEEASSSSSIEKTLTPVSLFSLPPLLVNEQDESNALIAFKCRHIFHAACCPHRACTVCFNDNFTMINTRHVQN